MKIYHSLFFGTGGVLLSFAAAVGLTPAWAGPSASRPAPASSGAAHLGWTANPALVARLAPEVKISVPGIGTYGIRPPRGFALKQINMTAFKGSGLIYLWTGPMQPDHTAANFTVDIGRDDSGMMPGMTSISFVQLEMSAMTRTHRNAKVSAIQQGSIHGLPFARAAWTGVGPRTGKMFQGIFYGRFVTPLEVMIEAKDESPASKVSMPLFNAAALTLRKL